VPSGATLVDDFEDPDWTLASDAGGLATTDREPVDTVRAMRVQPAPEHHAAALLRAFTEPQDWTACTALTFWIRPDRRMPLRALDIRLRDHERYGPPLKLVSHKAADTLPAGQWTELRYEFGKVQRDDVQILRIYFNRGALHSGPFDVDEMLLRGGPPAAAKKIAPSQKPPAVKKGPTQGGGPLE
jgi:hypothetical protein